HINVLELRTVVLALRHFLPRLSGQHVLVRTDNTSAMAYINRQGGVRSPSLHHWANRLLLWAAVHILSLRAVHIPRHLNYDPAPPAGAVQDCGRGQGIDIDSPPLAQSAVGCRSGQYVSGAALGAASAERPPNAGAQDSVAPTSRVVASQSLAPERCRLIASGLSDAVVATIQSPC